MRDPVGDAGCVAGRLRECLFHGVLHAGYGEGTDHTHRREAVLRCSGVEKRLDPGVEGGDDHDQVELAALQARMYQLRACLGGGVPCDPGQVEGVLE